jgi:hypothetical protein
MIAVARVLTRSAQARAAQKTASWAACPGPGTMRGLAIKTVDAIQLLASATYVTSSFASPAMTVLPPSTSV